MTQIHRVTDAKLHEFAELLLQRVGAEYKRSNTLEIISWLRNCAAQNTYQFICTPNAIHLSEIIRERLLPLPKAEEVFTLCRDPKNPEHIQEAKELLAHAFRWAKGFGANLFYLENICDVPREQIRTLLPTTKHIRLFEIPAAILDF